VKDSEIEEKQEKFENLLELEEAEFHIF